MSLQIYKTAMYNDKWFYYLVNHFNLQLLMLEIICVRVIQVQWNQ